MLENLDIMEIEKFKIIIELDFVSFIEIIKDCDENKENKILEGF